MLPTFARGAINVENALKRLLPKTLPPSLSGKALNLYQILSRTPGDFVGRKVHQTRWTSKKIEDTYWIVTKANLKCSGSHGKAWGQLYWKGKLINDKPTKIKGGLKYKWSEGVSIEKKV